MAVINEFNKILKLILQISTEKQFRNREKIKRIDQRRKRERIGLKKSGELFQNPNQCLYIFRKVQRRLQNFMSSDHSSDRRPSDI